MELKIMLLIASPVLLAGVIYFGSQIFWRTGFSILDKVLNKKSIKIKKENE